MSTEQPNPFVSSKESFDDLVASMFFLDKDFSEFRKKMLELGNEGRTFELVFVMSDLGDSDLEKKMRLRQLKAIREDSRLSKIVTRIVVKGKPGEASIEPNVFSSDVSFETLPE